MAVIQLDKMWDGAKSVATLAPDGTIADQETEIWFVRVDDPDNWIPALARSAPGIPQVGDVHPLAPTWLRVRQTDCERVAKHRDLYKITVTYGTQPENSSKTESGKWYVQVQSTGVERQIPQHEDRNGKPIVNSASDPFEPPLNRIFYDAAISVNFNIVPDLLDIQTLESLRGMVNSTQVTLTIYGKKMIYPPNTLLMAKADWSTQVGYGISFFSVSIVLHYRRLNSDGSGGWTYQLVDQGYNQKGPNDTKSKRITDGNSLEKTTITYLDGHGMPLADGAKAVHMDFDIQYQADLNVILADV